MPMKLSGSDRRIFKTMTSFPWDPQGGDSFYDAIENRSLYDPTKYGIARRALYDDPTEIVRFGCLGVRHCWRYYLANKSVEARCLWHVCITAFAINDFAAIDRIASDAPMTAPGTKSAYPAFYDSLFNLFFGVLRDDRDLLSHAVQAVPRKMMTANDVAVADCLIAIADRSPTAFSEAMQALCESIRKIRTMDPHYKFIDLSVHGLWELAFRMSPRTVESWDVQRPLPWDAELYSWLRKGMSAMDTIEDVRLSDAAREMLKMSIPL